MAIRTERIRGRRGVAVRKAVLREEPLCRACLAQGRYTASEEVDHIVPLHKGGTNDRDNLQGLCVDCHKAKTAGKRPVGLDGWPVDAQ